MRDSESAPPVESKPAAASGGIRQAKIGNRKERLRRDYAGFPEDEADGKRADAPDHNPSGGIVR